MKSCLVTWGFFLEYEAKYVESMLALLRRMQLWRMLSPGMHAPEAWNGECYGELNVYMSGRYIKAL